MTKEVETLRKDGKIQMLLAAANRYFETNEYAFAENHLKQALHLNPELFATLFQLSKLYYIKKEFALAEIYLLKTIKVKPDIAGIFSLLGIVRKELGKFSDAEQSYLAAIQVDPNFYEAYYNLGVLYHKNKQIAQAVPFYKKAIELNNGLYLAYYNLGNAYREMELFDEAEQYYLQTLQIKNDFADAYYNLGVIKEQLFDHENALRYYNAALLHDKNHVSARWNRSVILLLLQNYEEGFKEYEWRKRRKEYPQRNFSKPELTNQFVKGKTILVYDDQGLGDTIQFSRYLIKLKELGAVVVFECDKKLSGLFSGFKVIDKLVERSNNPEPEIEYDYHISLLSLPLYFKTSYQTIPGDISYITADEKLVEKWNQIIGKSKKIKVGLVWAGNPHHARDKHRSINYSEFTSLVSLENVEFFSLQKFSDDNLRLQLNDFNGITKLEINNFEDTAAIIENLDLVISVDTSVAHLAGAMGKPVWNLIYYYPDWRWSLEDFTTPWYPSMKLFRQPNPLNWKSVLEEVEQALKIFVRLKTSEEKKTLYAGLAKGNNFGWGVCSNYLKRELSKKINLVSIDEDENLQNNTTIDGTVLHALVDIDMNSLYKVRGSKNIGYAFFEYELTPLSLQNLKKYDLVLVGSTWNKKKLEQAGIKNVEVLIQGIDPDIFYPSESETDKKFFKIFSGGKFELRKGQDLVLKAVKILQQKYSDIVLVNAWYNFWPATMSLMSKSGHIKYELIGNNWEEYMLNLYKMNAIDASRILTLPLVANNKSREIYMYTDIGLFPNRAEGGTNLVLMEYMACGKPVIASSSTGHKDILTDQNSIKLKKMKEFKVYNEKKELIADWEEADIEEIISQIEYAYFNRDEIKRIGSNAATDLKHYTWESTADNLLKLLNRF
ncbi:MAG: tetratricopeptide repeat protein [Ignavibacteria bacterium]|nr:tetratricopeptide repeat protein [Ignavibacteria bacterium]